MATERPDGSRAGQFFETRYPLPAAALDAAKDDHMIIRFGGRDGSLAGGVFDVRLMRSAKP